MVRLFRKVVGKACNQEDCTFQGQSAELHQNYCEECGRALHELTVPARTRQLLAVLIACGALAGIGFKYFRSQRPSPHQETTPSVGLRDHTSVDAQRQLRVKLREIYRDCEARGAETANLTGWIAGNPGMAPAYAEFQRVRLPHVMAACHKVRTGQTLVAQKLFEHARADFLEATKEDPENANAWAALGGVDMLTKRQDEARHVYERALRLDPDNWVVHYNLGFYFARKGEKEAALQSLHRAVSLIRRIGGVDRATVFDDLRTNPVLEPLRLDPRFARLIG